MLKAGMIFALAFMAGNAHALTPDADICISRDFSYFQWSTETGCELSRSQMAGGVFFIALFMFFPEFIGMLKF